MAEIDIVCLGEPLFELSEVQPGLWKAGVGGDASNVAVAAARQGCSSAVITLLGDDHLGHAVRDFWDNVPNYAYFRRHLLVPQN